MTQTLLAIASIKFMTRFCICFSLIFFCNQLHAQQTLSSDTLHWSSAKPLAWDDFKGKPIDGIAFMGEAMCQIPGNFRKANAFQKPKFEVYAVFDRKMSWVDPGQKSDQSLTYFQVMFNLFELHARKMRKELNETKFAMDPSAQFYQIHSKHLTGLGEEFGQFRQETKLGQDLQALSLWKEKVSAALDELKGIRPRKMNFFSRSLVLLS